MSEDKSRIITLTEAADLYGFSQAYLRQLVLKGRLSARKSGGIWLTTPGAMESYIASRKRRGVFRGDVDVALDNTTTS